MPDTTDRICFYGKPDKVFKLDEYIKIPTMKELIEDLLPLVSIRKKGSKTQVVIQAMDPKEKHPYILGYNPLLLIDGVPVFDSDQFLQTNVPDIERIEIIYSTYYFENIIFDGIINLITRKGTCDIDLSTRSTRMTYSFMEPDKKFINPDYSDPAAYNNRTPDFRMTLYWNPQVMLDKEGKARIEFYTSDDTGEYIIDVEGYTSNGNKIKVIQKLIVEN